MAAEKTRADAADKTMGELWQILVMLKREMDAHATNLDKLELPKVAWSSASDRANAAMKNFIK